MEGLGADDKKRGQISTRTTTWFTDAAANVATVAPTSALGQDKGQ
jgi:hypothetical protein